MSENYFMSEAFERDAAKSVREAIDKANALGLPHAYGPAPVVPQQAVVVRISGAKKKIATESYPAIYARA